MEENKISAAETDFSSFDDEQEKEKELAAKQAKIEEDLLLPPDPDAILEVRHLKKYLNP